LAGITVVEAAHFVAGPLAGALLAELGARVVKLEPLAGDPFRRTGAQSVKFLLGKQSLALDLKRPEARWILDALVERADVFVHSYRPRVPAGLGVDAPRLAQLNPRLVYVCASAYGSRGPDRDRIAFHSTPTALSGAGIIQAGEGNPPVDDSFPDPGGALSVATAVLLALHAREHTGRGQYVETSMVAAAGLVLASETVDYPHRPDVAMPDQGQHGIGAWYRLYSCSSGWIFLAALDEASRRAVCEELGTDAEGQAQPVAALSELFARLPAAEWVARLRRRGVAAVPVGESDSQAWLAERGLLIPAEHPVFGRFWRLPPRIGFHRAGTVAGAPATIGEHTIELLRELGSTPEQVRRLIDSGVVAAAVTTETEAAL
jgi:crotonobetainyl-CoA:carnitine CoA-transferase CaiB-like acyl-CoA transferase